MKKALSILGLVTALAAGATVYALPASEVETFYFSDATLTDEVGYRLLACQGGTYREGRTTRHSVRFQTPCHSGGPSGVACVVDGISTTCPANICSSPLFSCP